MNTLSEITVAAKEVLAAHNITGHYFNVQVDLTEHPSAKAPIMRITISASIDGKTGNLVTASSNIPEIAVKKLDLAITEYFFDKQAQNAIQPADIAIAA